MALPDNLNIYAPGLTLLETITDEEDSFLNMAWSPDGRTLALASDDGASFATVDIETFTVNWHRVGYFAGVNDVAWSSNGIDVACICLDGTLLRYSFSEKKNTWTYSVTGAPKSVNWSPDGRLLAATGSYSWPNVVIWDARTGEIRLHLSGKSTVRPVFFSDSRRLACASMSDTPLTIWDVLSGQRIREFDNVEGEDGRLIGGHFGPVSALALSPDECLIATGGHDHNVTLWDVAAGRPIRCLKQTRGKLQALDFSPDSTFLAATSADNIMRVWSRENDWQQVVQLPDLQGGWIGDIVFHPTERLLVTCGQGGHSVQFWKYDPFAWR